MTSIKRAGCGIPKVSEADDEQGLQTNVFDGTNAWHYVNEDEENSITVIRDSPTVNPVDYSDFGNSYELSYEGTEMVEGRLVYVLSGKLREDDPINEQFTWWIDQKSWFPIMSETRTETSKATAIFRNIRINEPIDESLFEYTPPEGAEIYEIFLEDMQ